jgi:hypothetical protein
MARRRIGNHERVRPRRDRDRVLPVRVNCDQRDAGRPSGRDCEVLTVDPANFDIGAHEVAAVVGADTPDEEHFCAEGAATAA